MGTVSWIQSNQDRHDSHLVPYLVVIGDLSR
jgi:hypothetical protein